MAPPKLVVFSAVVPCIHAFIFSVTARDSVERSRLRSARSAGALRFLPEMRGRNGTTVRLRISAGPYYGRAGARAIDNTRPTC